MEARARVIDAGLFDGLLDWLTTALPTLGEQSDLPLLDAGCGEGSFLQHLCTRWGSAPAPLGLGVDLSAEGIRLAASRSKAQAWLVGDLAALPVADRTVGTLLNVLSPASYAEFRRVLVPGGLVVKVLPTGQHLRELRHLLGKTDYTNAPVADAFRASFPVIGHIRIEHGVRCGASLAEDLLRMTPLGWHASEPDTRRFLDAAPAQFTASFDVYWARASSP